MRPLTIAEARRRVVRVLITRIAAYGGYAGALIVYLVLALLQMGFEDGPNAGFVEPADFPVLAALAFGTTALLSAIVVQRATNPTAIRRGALLARAVVAFIVTVPFFGSVGVACGLLHLGAASDPGELAGPIVHTALVLAWVTLPFTIVTVPLGLVFGAVYAFAIDAARPLLDAPTRCAPARAKLVSLSVALAALVMTLVLLGLFRVEPSTCAVIASPLVLVALLDASLAKLDLRRAQRWLADVRADRAPGLRLVPLAECIVAPDLAPLDAIDREPSLAVIDARASAYRDRPVAIAIVPRSPS